MPINFCSCFLSAWRSAVALPEAVCDGGILFYIHRKVKKVLIFAAYLKIKNKQTSKWAKNNPKYKW